MHNKSFNTPIFRPDLTVPLSTLVPRVLCSYQELSMGDNKSEIKGGKKGDKGFKKQEMISRK